MAREFWGPKIGEILQISIGCRDLIKVHAVEAVDEDEGIELTSQQKEALDKELHAISSNPAYMQKWDEIRD